MGVVIIQKIDNIEFQPTKLLVIHSCVGGYVEFGYPQEIMLEIGEIRQTFDKISGQEKGNLQVALMNREIGLIRKQRDENYFAFLKTTNREEVNTLGVILPLCDGNHSIDGKLIEILINSHFCIQPGPILVVTGKNIRSLLLDIEQGKVYISRSNQWGNAIVEDTVLQESTQISHTFPYV